MTHPLLDVLRCPRCGAALSDAGEAVVCAEGHSHGLIGGHAPDLVDQVTQADSMGQLAMRFRPLVTVYERVWRPLFTAFAGGRDPDEETALLAGWLDAARDGVVVDIACGPGNTTRRLAEAVRDDRVLGLDLSIPMLEQAVAGGDVNGRVAYARADVHHLPIDADAIEAVHCAAALYLISDPGAVLAEIARILRPGGRLVGMTLVAPTQPIGPLGRAGRSASSALSGLHYFGADELEAMCRDAGLDDVHHERHGASLLFRADRPRA